jgi:hypothetical protein
VPYSVSGVNQGPKKWVGGIKVIQHSQWQNEASFPKAGQSDWINPSIHGTLQFMESTELINLANTH